MPGFKESFCECSALLLPALQRIKEGESPGMGIYSVAILNALAIAFPDKVRDLDRRACLTKLSSALSLCIACNDFCDVGLAAARRRGCQETFLPLLSLERYLLQRMNTLVEGFTASFPDQLSKQLTLSFASDSLFMAQISPRLPPLPAPL